MKKQLAISLMCLTFLNAENMHNMCEDALVKKEKNNYSKTIKFLKHGDKINVLEKQDFYITSFHDSGDGLAIWAKLDNGYVSYKCLISEDSYKRIQKGATRKNSSENTKVAKKGFSEAEDGDNVAMRGAAGKAKFGKANYAQLEFISSLYKKNAQVTYRNFRKDGKLGEYK